MSTVPPDVDDAPGQLLRELERRQDDVIAQLDRLNEQVEAVLEKLGVRLDGEPQPVAGQTADGEEEELAEAA